MNQRIETQRLCLRPWTMEDLADFHHYASQPQVGPNAGWKPHGSLEESRALLEEWLSQEEDLLFAIEHKETGTVIGSIGIHEDRHRPKVPDCKMLGYVLSQGFWGKGLMTEGVNAILDYVFLSLKVKLFTVYHFSHNLRSRRVIEKCGFRYEGTMRRASVIYDGTVKDDCMYSMTAGEYHLRQAKKKGVALTLPEELPQGEILSYQAEWEGVRMNPFAMCLNGKSFEAWLNEQQEHRTAVPANYVTATGWFFTDEAGKPLGALHLRHVLNEGLLFTGGHIGYGIRPTARGKHLAPMMLALGLEKAKERGITRVLVTCNEDNAPSAATIEACGGVRENTVQEDNGNRVHRYWIDL